MAVAGSHSKNRSARSNPIELIADSLAFGVVFTISLTVVQRAVGFFRGVLFCRFMTDEQLGQWSMIFSFLMMLAPLAALGLPGSFSRFVEHYLQKGQIGTFLRRIAIVSCSLTLLLSGTMYFYPEPYSQLIFRSSDYVILVNTMAFTLVMVAASNFLVSLIESLRQVRLAAIMRFIQGIGFATFGLLFISIWENSVSGATFGFGIACLLCSIPAVWFLWHKQTALEDSGDYLTQSTMWSRIAPFAIWLWASNLVWNMFEVADRYMLVHWSNIPVVESHSSVGQYHSARVVPMLLVGVAVVLEGVLTPYMTALWEKKRTKEAGKQLSFALKLLALGFTIGSVLIMLISPLLFETVLAGRYNDGLAVLPTTLLYSTWFSMFLFGQIYLWIAEKGKWVFATTAAGLILNLFLNAMLIPQFELWGAVLATTLATLFCLLATLVANRLFNNPIGAKGWATCALPLIILLPLPVSAALAVLLLTLTLGTNWFFDREERTQIFERLVFLVGKLSR